jgi:hypothetical protein
MCSEEVGLAPGSYRIIDLYCFREVLNQIMKVVSGLLPLTIAPQCSCQSSSGFGIFQSAGTPASISFHTVLDIVCRSCSQKVVKRPLLLFLRRLVKPVSIQVSFGTSTIVDAFSSGVLSKPDIDLRIESCFQHLEDQFTVVRKFQHDLYTGAPEWQEAEEPADTAVVHVVGEEQGLALEQMDSDHPISLSAFTCNICRKEFKKLFNLKQHVRTHTNEKPLQCSQCDKRFNDRSSMNKHVRTVHSAVRPHRCSVCDKCFPTNSHLADHQATHTNQKKFHCLQCGKRFAFRSSLNKHHSSHQRLASQWSSDPAEGI